LSPAINSANRFQSTKFAEPYTSIFTPAGASIKIDSASRSYTDTFAAAPAQAPPGSSPDWEKTVPGKAQAKIKAKPLPPRDRSPDVIKLMILFITTRKVAFLKNLSTD